jgi:Domain of unknown function (DUF4303)
MADILLDEIKTACKAAFKEIAKKSKGENIYVFALYSDEGAMTVCPAANTETHLQEQFEENGKDPYFKFGMAEWKYESVGAEKLFDKICKKVSKEAENCEGDRKKFAAFKNSLFETCITALQQLREEGFFDKDILLLFGISDSEPNKKFEKEMATRLNSVKQAKEYLNWVKTL